MKKLILEILIISILVLVPSAAIAADKVTVDTDEHLVMALIIDRSDVGKDTWNRSLILARQAMSLLKRGDELILITAVRDRIVIETSFRIDPDSASQRTRLNQKLMTFKYKWWCRARIADALQLAYSELNNRPSGRKCCIVLSDGRYDNSEVNAIRRKAAVYRLSGIPLLMTVAGSANKNLLLAGSQGELDVAIIEKSDLAGWFDRVRPHRDTSTAAITPQPDTSLPDTSLSSPLPGGKTETPPKLESDDTLHVRGDDGTGRLPYILPVYPMPDKVFNPPSPNEVKPLTKPSILGKTKEPQRPEQTVSRGKRNRVFVVAGVIGAVSLVLIMFYLARYLGNRKPSSLDIEGNVSGEKECRLVAMCKGQRYDLGEEHTATNLVIGTNPGSVIPLMDEDADGEFFRIRYRRGKLEIKNLAHDPLTINSIVLKKGRKRDVILPATIQVNNKLKIDIYREAIEPNEQDVELEGE